MLSMALERTLKHLISWPPMSKIKSTCGSKPGRPEVEPPFPQCRRRRGRRFESIPPRGSHHPRMAARSPQTSGPRSIAGEPAPPGCPGWNCSTGINFRLLADEAPAWWWCFHSQCPGKQIPHSWIDPAPPPWQSWRREFFTYSPGFEKAAPDTGRCRLSSEALFIRSIT